MEPQNVLESNGLDCAIPLTPGFCIDGRYHLITRLGRGAMGEVWHAQDLKTTQDIALKFFRSGADAEEEIPSHIKRAFEQEVSFLAKLRSPGVVGLMSRGFLPGCGLFLVMEYLEGETLSERLKRVKQMSVSEVLELLEAMAKILQEIHARGIVHRDLSPSNIYCQVLYGGGHCYRLLDFGVAAKAGSKPNHIDEHGLTGTVQYMAPEQFGGSSLPASDFYSLGCIAWECLVGKPLFDGVMHQILHAHLCHKPEFPKQLKIPQCVQELVLWLLEKNCRSRLQNNSRLIEEIQSIKSNLCFGAKRKKWVSISSFWAVLPYEFRYTPSLSSVFLILLLTFFSTGLMTFGGYWAIDVMPVFVQKAWGEDKVIETETQNKNIYKQENCLGNTYHGCGYTSRVQERAEAAHM